MDDAFAIEVLGKFDEPWAIALLPGGDAALITERRGRLLLWRRGEPARSVAGVPEVDYGGQGGLGDVAVQATNDGKGPLVYLSWVEAGSGDTRGAVAARARLVLEGNPRLEALDLFWRQQPKVSGRGHFSHRFAFSANGATLYIASGDRQKMAPAQDPASDLGKIFRFGAGNPDRVTDVRDPVSLGHRNILGMKVDPQGRLWEVEHGPAGGDELNLVKQGANYGWPVVSEGDHYGGQEILPHSARPDLVAPALSWNPVIGPGDMIFYSGRMWPEWKDQVLIAGMVSQGLVRVRIAGETASEQARYPLGKRIRAITEAPDGSLLVLEDGTGGRLLRLSRK